MRPVLIAEAGSHPAGGFHPRMVRRHQLELACDLIQRHGFGVVAACRHHHAKFALVDQVGASAAQARGKDSIFRAGRASALHIAKDGDAGLKMRQFLKLVGQAQRVALMPDLKRGDLALGLQLLVQGLGAFERPFRRFQRRAHRSGSSRPRPRPQC